MLCILRVHFIVKRNYKGALSVQNGNQEENRFDEDPSSRVDASCMLNATEDGTYMVRSLPRGLLYRPVEAMSIRAEGIKAAKVLLEAGRIVRLPGHATKPAEPEAFRAGPAHRSEGMTIWRRQYQRAKTEQGR